MVSVERALRGFVGFVRIVDHALVACTSAISSPISVRASGVIGTRRIHTRDE